TNITVAPRDENQRPRLFVNGGILQVDSDTVFQGPLHVVVEDGGLKVTGDVTLDSDALLGIENATVDGTGRLISQGRLELSDVTVSANLRNEGILVSADENSIEGTFENAEDAQLQIATSSGLPSTLTVAQGFANEGQI